MEISLLGPAAVKRRGEPLALPRSRKVRALLAYLALGSGPFSRSRLCDLLWDVPNDPRGELRWCLSKLRGVLDDEDRKRVIAAGNDSIALDLSDCRVDVLELDRVTKNGLGVLSAETLDQLASMFGGDLLEGLEIDGSPELTGWLAARRQHFRALHVAILAELTARSPAGSDETFRRLEAWLERAPFDQRAHEIMLEQLVDRGRVRDAEEHVARAIRAYEQDGLDWSPLRAAWQAMRTRPSGDVSGDRKTNVSADRKTDASADRKIARRRASVAVMPFVDRGSSSAADGMTEDVITRLAKLRVLFVIARGTTYALAERGLVAQEVGKLLHVEYVVSGSVEKEAGKLSVVVELVETETARIVWTDEIHADAFTVLDTLVDRLVASIAEEIEQSEMHRAILAPPSSLDAWEAYHRGLWHMYKFNGPDNHEAGRFFSHALSLDPTFSRAHAGLSFTHFQNAFLDLTPDRDRQIALAFETAARSIESDGRDPGAHWALGRALWLRGERDESFASLRRCVELSPNFALGHYTLGFVYCQAGDPRSAIEATNHSRQLSPFDPLQFAMLASRALAHIRLGEIDEAADWAVKATGRPNAHVHILAIAAQSLTLANRREEARKFVARIRERVPGYAMQDFLRAFRFDDDTTHRLKSAAKQIGFDR